MPRTTAQPGTVLPFEEARRAVERAAVRVRPALPEIVDLLECAGRVLAEDVQADRDLPPFPRATRDGYAVRSADLASLPARLRVTAEIRAGGIADAVLAAGQAAEIMTGAAIPAGADAVVMVEHTSRQGDVVEIGRAAAAGDNIVPAGSEARRGDVLLRAGTRLTPAAIAVAASVGRAHLSVYTRPRVAILATGDELVEVAGEPGPTQIRNSNSYSLAAQVNAAGAIPVVLPVAPDEPAQLRNLVREGLAADLLLLSGGVSAGKYDLVEQVLDELGAEFLFTGALIQPGRPVVFGRAPARSGALPTYFFGLPGNPVSTLVTFELFARVLVEALSGTAPRPLVFPKATLKKEIRVKPGLTRFLPGLLSGEFADAQVELVRWQGSGDVVATARANCFVVVPPDREVIAAGELVSVLVR